MDENPDTPVGPPEKRVSPDGLSVAIRTIFEDDTPGAVSAWLAVDQRGIATYLTAPQVSDWTAV